MKKDMTGLERHDRDHVLKEREIEANGDNQTGRSRFGADPLQGSKHRVLVVDDDEFIREILKGMFSYMGYEVRLASNGHEGLIRFVDDRFDLVVSDLDMPGMDGWSLALKIKDKTPDTPVIVMTGQAKTPVMERLKQGPVDVAMFKPFVFKEVEEAVKKAMRPDPSESGDKAPVRRSAV